MIEAIKTIGAFLGLIFIVPLVLICWVLGFFLGNLAQGFLSGFEKGRG